jgi:hypothetical protein
MLVALFVAVTCSANSCGSDVTKTHLSGKTVFVLFDLSGSTNAKAEREKYADGFRQIVEKLEAGDVIVADAINENPLALSSFPVNQEFPSFAEKTDNELLRKKLLQEHDEKVKGIRDEVFNKANGFLNDATRVVKRTHILDSLQLAERVFKTYERSRRVLVVFSDMLEESDRYNFARQPPNEDLAAKIISGEKEAKRLPDLTGAKVYIIGASNVSAGARSDSYRMVEGFWLQYFKEIGADLPKERYGSALLQFNE